MVLFQSAANTICDTYRSHQERHNNGNNPAEVHGQPRKQRYEEDTHEELTGVKRDKRTAVGSKQSNISDIKVKGKA